jgi:C1A family cysteine protease
MIPGSETASSLEDSNRTAVPRNEDGSLPVAAPTSVHPAVYYDPYSPVEVGVSLLDNHDEEEEEEGEDDGTDLVFTDSRLAPQRRSSAVGTAGLLEMEDPDQIDEEDEVLFDSVGTAVGYPPGVAASASPPEEPLRTDSGLLLTHRKSLAVGESVGGTVRSRHPLSASGGTFAPAYGARGTELEHDGGLPWYPHHRSSQSGSDPYGPPRLSSSFFVGRAGWGPPSPGGRSAGFKLLLQRWLSFARLWVVASAALLFLGMTVVVRHVGHESKASSSSSSSVESQIAMGGGTSGGFRVVSISQFDGSYDSDAGNQYPDRLILLPLPEGSLSHRHHAGLSQHSQSHHHQHRHLLPSHHEDDELHDLFVQWKATHGKQYSSHHEHLERFHIWKSNHRRIQRKNERHGPCRLTSQPVFGTNHLSDLTEQEFREQYLSGYGVPRERSDPSNSAHAPPVLDPDAADPEQQWKSSVRQRQSGRQQHQRARRAAVSQNSRHEPTMRTSIESCDWYDVSCILRYIFETYFYGLGRTMEPIYDADSYPLMVDWRAVGAVTDVHSQGSCGACWAITAVETVESANYLGTGTLVDLSETEVIVCTEETEWCSGGWPQSAFEYIINQKGVPLESDLPYDANYLLSLTEAREAGDAYVSSPNFLRRVLFGLDCEFVRSHVNLLFFSFSDGTVKAYMQSICPSGKGGGGGGHSGDNKNGGGGGGNGLSRYGYIKGYGYATEKCVCYTDGSGCDCDSQNEGLAVRNVATYGPAVVCVDASTWQDYNGGIMTADSGCSSKFLDVNHCVQVVGYAFATAGGSEEQQNSHSNSRDRGSKDNSDRIGYWIVRNQWSTYWGMNGFAYVAMGENTCGILNDMIQVYA